MGGGSGLIETIKVGSKTAISVGNVTVKLQCETTRWELHAVPRRSSPAATASEVANEWANRLRNKRNALLQGKRDRKKALEAARKEEESSAPVGAYLCAVVCLFVRVFSHKYLPSRVR